MSSGFFDPDQNRPLGRRPETSPFFQQPSGGNIFSQGNVFTQPSTQPNIFDSPILPRNRLTSPVESNPSGPTSLGDTALGRAYEILDRVRARRVRWQDAKPALDRLSEEDKRTIAISRGELTPDEQRALGFDDGNGDGSLFSSIWDKTTDYTLQGVGRWLGLRGLEKAIRRSPDEARDNIVGDTLSNLAGDITTTVKDTPAGIALGAKSFAIDVARTVQDPLGQSSIYAYATGGEQPRSEVWEKIAKPTAYHYQDVYGPLFTGDPMTTAKKIQEHPLGPVLDTLALASMGYGTALRVSAGNARMHMGTVTKEQTGKVRVGVPKQVTDTYEPLGLHMAHYVRPTTQDIKHNPGLVRFSVLTDVRTGESLFSPAGSSHDEIYERLDNPNGTATQQQWNSAESALSVLQGTGIFDPRTGKVVNVNVDPEDAAFVGMEPDAVQKLMDKVTEDAKNLYTTAGELESRAKDSLAGTVEVIENPGKRHDPITGESLGKTYYVKPAGKRRVAANFPNEASAIAHAQSLTTGGIRADILATELQDFFEPVRGELGIMALPGRFEAKVITEPGDPEISAAASEILSWPDISPKRRGRAVDRGYVGPGPMAEAAISAVNDPDFARMMMGGGGDTGLIVLRDAQGKVASVGSFMYTPAGAWPGGRGSPIRMPRDPVIQLGTVGANKPGAGVALLMELAKKFPGADVHFDAANRNVGRYYEETLGAEEIAPGLYGISKEQMAELAQGRAIKKGPRKQQRVAVGVRGTERGLFGRKGKKGEKILPLPQPKTPGQLWREAFFQRRRGNLWEVYDQARGKSHLVEIEEIVEEIVTVFGDPAARVKAGVAERLQQAIDIALEDFVATRGYDVEKYQELIKKQPEFFGPPLATAARAVGITLREASDLVRAGAVFIRPAYIPNNWAGNAFLLTIYSGMYAPMNLAKSLVTDKHIGTLYTRAMDQSLGFNAASLMTAERGTGYFAAGFDPVAKLLGSIADQPFRRAAWYHAAREEGFKTMDSIQQLWDKGFAERKKFAERHAGDLDWDPETTPALHMLGKIGRKAQEEMVKFNKYNDMERQILRNLIFVYSWMRGSARYFGRFPMAHPIQAAAFSNLGNIGEEWLNEEMGGVPNFLIGAIPVGKDSQGNTTIINPFSVNPLGTGMEWIMAGGSLQKILTNPDEFNKYSQTDPIGLLNPLIQNFIEAREGGRSVMEANVDAIAALRTIENVQHPGRGQVYPTTRGEALGQFTFGSLFPRKTRQAAITASLRRERHDQPEKRIDDELELIRETLGYNVPQFFVKMYRADLEAVERQEDFQHEYAKDHGSQGFDNMPPANRAEAALDYLSKYHLVTPEQVSTYREIVSRVTTDEEMNELANAFWRMTGAGRVKDKWDDLVRQGLGTSLTPERP